MPQVSRWKSRKKSKRPRTRKIQTEERQKSEKGGPPVAYADFDFYVTEYGGSAVNVDDFSFLANKASVYIDAMTMRRARSADGEVLEAVKMAVCALADVFLDEENMNAAAFSEEALMDSLSSETVGRWSKSFKTKSVSAADSQELDRRKTDALTMYLGWTGLLSASGHYARHY